MAPTVPDPESVEPRSTGRGSTSMTFVAAMGHAASVRARWFEPLMRAGR